MGKFHLIEEASTYGSYHKHPMNRFIHFVFVPVIVFAFTLWFSLIPGSLVKVSFLNNYIHLKPEVFSLNITIFLIVIVCLYYCTLDILSGILLFFIFFLFEIISNYIHLLYGDKETFLLGFVLQIVGWSIQVIIGHEYFERRKPAITDSLFQAIVSPFFLMLEFLFIFGYRHSLYEKIEQETQKKINYFY
jgi:uncharacterized membrane protein YGL010W